MKRKLDHLDVPHTTAQVPLPTEVAQKPEPSLPSFTTFSLDLRLLQNIQAQKFAYPTPVQNAVIPLILRGKSVLARSQTGSGKTAAYVIPILNQSLSSSTPVPDSAITRTPSSVTAIVLTPTRELAAQVTQVIKLFSAGTSLRALDLSRNEDVRVQAASLAASPHIIVSTPAKLHAHLDAGFLNATDSTSSPFTLRTLVVDEADLMLAHGYKNDLQQISNALVIGKGVQVVLTSATAGEEVRAFGRSFGVESELEMVNLDETERQAEENEQKKGPSGSGLMQYVVKCAEQDKFLLLYAIFILKLITGKVIIFVGDVDRCYRVKLFLEQFGIRSCVLNSQLPVNSRIHVVEEFNKNIYDIIIATDENEIVGKEFIKQSEENEDGNVEEKPDKKHKPPRVKDSDYGVARGIDFRAVSCVINFDLPLSATSYTHRIGRTARAGQSGTALSFVIPKTLYRKHKPTSIPSTSHDEEVLVEIIKNQEAKGRKIGDYAFDMTKLEGFRYRFGDALRAVTGSTVREARLKELRSELIKSEKLKRHFDENPDELRHLRHDGELTAARVQPHLKHVPDYLLPGGAKKVSQQDIEFANVPNPDGERKKRKAEANRNGKSKLKSKKVNPLQPQASKSRTKAR